MGVVVNGVGTQQATQIASTIVSSWVENGNARLSQELDYRNRYTEAECL